MATYKNGIMGPFNGKVGTVVGYMWNGKYCMRAYNRNVKNPRTEAQMEHRRMFKQEVQLAAKMRWAVGTTMREAAREAGLTAYNLFVKVNQPAFGMEGGRLLVDYSALVLSMGDVAQVAVTGMEWTADNVLNVSYDRGLGRSYDHVYLYVYVSDLGEGFLSAPAYRRDKRIVLALPDSFVGHEAHVYLMVQSEDGRWSDSLYGGALALSELVIEEETETGVQMDAPATADAGALTSAEGLQGIALGGPPPGD